MIVDRNNPRALLVRLILAELIARPGQGPLALRTQRLPRAVRSSAAAARGMVSTAPRSAPEEPG